MRGSVVDASAVAAIVFGEPGAERTAAALGDGALHAPSLLPYELTSVARKKSLAHPAQRQAILQALDRVEDLCITLVDVNAAEVARMARREGISAYDAAYLWLAQRLALPLVSLERRLLAAARRNVPRRRLS